MKSVVAAAHADAGEPVIGRPDQPSAAARPGTGVSPIAELPVSALMRRGVLTVTPEETLPVAAELMRRTGYHHLPIVRDDGRCVGILDALTVARRWHTAALWAAHTVVDVLERRPKASVVPEAPVAKAARCVLLNGNGAVPVVDHHGVFIGLLTADDLLAAIAGEPSDENPASGVRPYRWRMVPAPPQRAEC